MIKLIMLFIFLSCNKFLKELVHKDKIGEKYWEYIVKDEYEELEELLRKDQSIGLNTLINEEGETSLTLAAKHNSLGVIKLLLSKGVYVNEVNAKGQTSLIVSLLQTEDSIERDEIIDRLLEKDADVNFRYGLYANNALMLAIIEKDFYTANKILNKKIDINAQNLDEETALILVSKNKDIEEVTKSALLNKLLKFEDIDINIKDSEGNRAVTYIINDNNSLIMNTFLKSPYRGIMINEMLEINVLDLDNAHTTNRNNLFMLALEEDISTIKKIIDKGVDINYQNILGETALIMAIKNKSMQIEKKEEIVKILLGIESINVNLRDKEGRPAITYTIMENNLNILKMLLKSDNIKVNNVPDKEGRGPLDYLDINNFKIELFISLIEKDAIVVDREYFYERVKKYYLEEIVRFL